MAKTVDRAKRLELISQAAERHRRSQAGGPAVHRPRAAAPSSPSGGKSLPRRPLDGPRAGSRAIPSFAS